MVCEGMWGNSCGGREMYIGEWREEAVKVGEWVGRRDGRKGTREGRRKKGKETVEKGRVNINSITSTSEYPHSPTAPGSVILAAVDLVAIRCCAESFAVSHTFTLIPIKIGTSGTPLGTNATACVGILDER